MFVTRTVEYEVDDYLGEDLIDNILDDGEYIIAVDENGNTITYYDLDAKNQAIFLKALQEQFDTKIANIIDSLKEKEAAATN